MLVGEYTDKAQRLAYYRASRPRRLSETGIPIAVNYLLVTCLTGNISECPVTDRTGCKRVYQAQKILKKNAIQSDHVPGTRTPLSDAK